MQCKLVSILGLILAIALVGPAPLASLPGTESDPEEGLLDADLVCEATVLETRSEWREDEQGRHIYTRVRLLPGRRLKGNLPDQTIQLDLQGGTVGPITERVSLTPVFRRGERAVVFLRSRPWRLAAGARAKLPIKDGQVLWKGRMISLERLAARLSRRQQEPLDDQQTQQSSQTGPVLYSIEPATGPAGVGAEVNIVGAGFGQVRGRGFVEFFYRTGRPKISALILSWSEKAVRCTVPVDVIEGYSASASSGPIAIVLADGIRSNELPFRVTFGYDGSRWDKDEVQYLVNENAHTCQDEGQAIEAAAGSWNRTGASVRLVYAGPHSRASSSYNGRNEVLWGRTDKGLAVTWTWEVSGVVLECDTVFNDRYQWSTADQPESYQMDVQTVALHEFGHWVGLRDLYGDLGDGEYDVAKVMYGFGSAGKVKRQPHPDDVAGIHFAYPPPLPPDPPGALEYPEVDLTGHFTVRWAASSQASGYELCRSDDGGLNWQSIYIGPHTYMDQTIGPGMYRFRVRATNAAGPSEWLEGQWDCLVAAAD